MRLDDELIALAHHQQGCVSVSQAAACGASATEISRRRRSVLWRSMGRRVLGLRSWPQNDLHAASAAVLEAGDSAALGHSSAAAMWGLGEYYRLVPAQVVQIKGAAKARAGGRIHPIVRLPQAWITRVDGIAVVRPELCIYELCGTEHPRRAERALDRAWSMGLLSGASTRACLTEMRRSGRNGTILLQTLLDARPGNYVPPASGLEGRFNEIAIELGYRMRRQVDSGGSRWDGRVDFRDEVLPVIVEVLSERYHAALTDKEADAERRARLERAGFIVVELWDTQVWHRRAEVETALRDTYRDARHRFGSRGYTDLCSGG